MRFYGEILEYDEMIGFTSNYHTVQTIVNICCEQCLPQMRASHPEPERIQEVEDISAGEHCCVCGKAAKTA